MFISSTASRALRPSQGEPAPWALSPANRYSTDTMPFPPLSPQLTDMSLLTWE